MELGNVEGCETGVAVRAFIHAVGGEAFNEECASAKRGFEQLGVETVLFSNNERLEMAGRDDVVVGGMMVCEQALAMHGVAMPHIGYPYSLQKYLGRRIDRMPAMALKLYDLPVFVKPVVEKDLPGKAIRTASDLDPYLAKGKTYSLYVSEHVNFVSEWRCYIRYRRVLGSMHYFGDSSIEPDWLVAKHIIGSFYSGRPNGYGIDLGVTDDGRTVLVEINDGFALGNYGINDVSYALLLSARWAQLMGVLDELHDVVAPEAEGAISEDLQSQRWQDYRFGEPGVSIPASEPDLPGWVWGIAANIREYPMGTTAEEAKGRRRGTKHFAPGAHVWILDENWSPDWRMPVVGKKKGTHRYIRKVMCLDELENFRAKRVYSPTVISWMRGARSDIPNFGDCGKYSHYGDLFYGTYWDREEAECLAELWNRESADGL